MWKDSHRAHASAIRRWPCQGNSWLNHGFTLLELLIAVAVVGILASIAVPSYQRHVQSARVSDGQAKLMEISGRLERCYTANYSYLDCVSLPIDSDEGYYSIDFDGTPAGAGYRLRATAKRPQQVKCDWLAFQQTGVRDSDHGCW